MIVDLADINDIEDLNNYPPGTEFLLHDTPIKYDPEIFEVVRPTSEKYSYAVTKEELIRISKNM